MMKCSIQPFIIIVTLFCFQSLYAQEDWDFDMGETEEENIEIVHSFYDTRVINGHSVETLEKRVLDLRISHRFGDIAVASSGRTLYGLDVSTDIRIALEYGIIDKLSIGFGRSKGSGPYSEVWDGFAKYALLSQSSTMPLSLTLTSSAFATSMAVSSDPISLNSFKKTSHRFSYYSQLIVARNLFDIVSLQASGGLLHQNYVTFEEDNTHFCLGVAGKVKLFGKFSLVGEYYHIFRNNSTFKGIEHHDPLAVGVEIKTFAHVFQLNFINSEGLGEGQFLPYTRGGWLDGRFRFGFTISRHFQL